MVRLLPSRVLTMGATRCTNLILTGCVAIADIPSLVWLMQRSLIYFPFAMCRSRARSGFLTPRPCRSPRKTV